jgi:hypothetical protein
LSEAAFRAAGQALAALWQGAPIGRLDIDGIELDWPGQLTRKQSRKQLEMEINIGLAGIAAQDRFRFGWVPDHKFIGSWQFNQCQIEDFRLVRDLRADPESC